MCNVKRWVSIQRDKRTSSKTNVHRKQTQINVLPSSVCDPSLEQWRRAETIKTFLVCFNKPHRARAGDSAKARTSWDLPASAAICKYAAWRRGPSVEPHNWLTVRVSTWPARAFCCTRTAASPSDPQERRSLWWSFTSQRMETGRTQKQYSPYPPINNTSDIITHHIDGIHWADAVDKHVCVDHRRFHCKEAKEKRSFVYLIIIIMKNVTNILSR